MTRVLQLEECTSRTDFGGGQTILTPNAVSVKLLQDYLDASVSLIFATRDAVSGIGELTWKPIYSKVHYLEGPVSIVASNISVYVAARESQVVYVSVVFVCSDMRIKKILLFSRNPESGQLHQNNDTVLYDSALGLQVEPWQDAGADTDLLYL